MRLSKLEVSNYRSCYETTVQFSDYLTLLVGENDAGKSNIIDAIRVAVPPVSGRTTLWFDLDRDLSHGQRIGDRIRIKRTYVDLTTAEDAFYIPAIVDPHRNLIHTTCFLTEADLARRHRVLHTVGDDEVPDPEPENRDRIAHVYLPPLRDASAALDSSAGNRLADVFRAIATEEEIAEFELTANASLRALATNDTALKVVEGVQVHLTAVTEPVRHRIVDVKHREQRLASLARSLRMHMAAKGFTPTDLLGSGLGYANLLYIATVVLELVKARDYDLLLLLVEEPEAHLHPQLQTVLLGYLAEQARSSATNAIAAGMRAGRIQVIATTHSPHLASSVSTRDVAVVRFRERVPLDGCNDDGFDLVGESAVAGETSKQDDTSVVIHGETATATLSAMALSDAERRKVDRYLDATRASLLFARQIILVEGVAEALLLRTLAEELVYPASADAETPEDHLNQRRRREFRAITVVPIGGVDFMPYLKLLFHDNLALADRVVVVTDGDGGAGARRKGDIEAAFLPHIANGCLTVAVGETTLEAELYAAPSNEDLLREAFRIQHPRSLAKWDAICSDGVSTPEERAVAFSKALKDGQLDLGKGDFAQVVAELIVEHSDKTQFTVPSYLEQAITAAVMARGDEPIAGHVV